MTGRFPITRGARYSVVMLFVLTLLLAGANLLWTARAVTRSQHQWCDTLSVLDAANSHAPPPTSEYAARFRADIHHLRGRFGCP